MKRERFPRPSEVVSRTIVSVRWSKVEGWVVTWGNKTCVGLSTKKAAIIKGRLEAQVIFGRGKLSQLRVFGKNGRIQFEHTYGKDPRRSKG